MDDAQALQLLRRQRHSLLNHLQVISGWLQIQRPERALQYLNGLADRMADESEAMRQGPPLLGLLVLELGMEAETYGVRLLWRCRGPLESVPEGLREQVLAAVHGVGEQGQVLVSLSPEHFTVHTVSAEGEG